jgi:hypothetical protein
MFLMDGRFDVLEQDPRVSFSKSFLMRNVYVIYFYLFQDLVADSTRWEHTGGLRFHNQSTFFERD